jgi:HlyD family secretion protein
MTTATSVDAGRPRLDRPERPPRRRRRLSRLWLVPLLVGAAGVWVAIRGPELNPSPNPHPEPRALPIRVSALGRLAPESEVIALAPSSGADGGRVDRLLVAVGDRVQAGQVVAILDPYARRAAAVRQARAQAEVARAKLAQAQAGSKLEDVRAQEALVERYQAEFQAAERDLGRAALLFKKAAGSRQDLDDQELKYEQARDSLNQARAQLAALKAIRPVDVQVARAELMHAEAGLEVARADLQAAEVRSPISGRVLRIHTQPGERAGDQGILDVGNVDVMHVVAEVYEEDASRVLVGQAARVRVPSLGAELSGLVVRKDLVVGRKVIFNNDPVADTDARVIEVRIRLAPEDGSRVAGLSNARAEVVIDANGGAR